jgi:hypothetical protein
MPRSKITSVSKDVIGDDGTILLSLIHGEQTRMIVTLGWLTSLAGYEISCKIVEGDNAQGSGLVPTAPAPNAIVRELVIIDNSASDNTFGLVIPEDLISNWQTTPEVDLPIYGFIGLEVRDSAVGVYQQVWKPMRGVVQIMYSPTEEELYDTDSSAEGEKEIQPMKKIRINNHV